MSTTFDDYQAAALTTAIRTGNDTLDLCHWVLGITGESGEIAEKVKKIIRDHDGVLSDEAKGEIAKEIGDVLWYLAVLAETLGFSLGALADANIEKLASRKARGVLGGSGDNR